MSKSAVEWATTNTARTLWFFFQVLFVCFLLFFHVMSEIPGKLKFSMGMIGEVGVMTYFTSSYIPIL